MLRLNRSDVPILLFIFLVIVALGTVSATITSMVGTEGGGFNLNVDSRGGDVGGDLEPVDRTNESSGDFQDSGSQISLVICIEFLRTAPAMLGIVAGTVLLLYGIYRQFNVATALLSGSMIIPFIWAGYFFTTNCTDPEDASMDGGLFDSSAAVSNQGGLASPNLPPEVFAALFGLIIVVGSVLLFKMTGEEETYKPIEDEPEVPDTEAFALAAGRAADRIEEANVPVDNAVYQAWLEMTLLLDFEDPSSTTPRAFADMAVEAGLDRDDVDELTELFNEVRYGGKDPGAREERAIEVLRNIEHTYEDAESSEEGDN